MERRRMSQPVGEQSAGSVFRNPSDMGVALAELIDKTGLNQSGRGHGIQNHAKFSSIAVAQPLETCLSSLPE
ncbi:hypothetical protein ACLB2K_012681 [Fragaria x ananassa]